MSLNEIAKVLKGPSVPTRGDVQKKLKNAATQPPESKPKRIGRPPGKRTNPEYGQVGAWIRNDTYERVRIALIKQGNREFSELVEELLQDWLHRQAKAT